MALRELFAPWFRELQRDTELDGDPDEEAVSNARTSSTLWISWTAAQVRGHDALPSEALEILALIERVDRNAWLGIVGQLWPQASGLWGRLLRGSRFQLGVEISITTETDLSRVCGPFAVGCVGLFGSDHYKRVRQHLEAMAVTAEAQSDHISAIVPVRIRVCASETTDASTDALWLQMLQLASLQTTLDRRLIGTVHPGYDMPSLLRLTQIKVDIGSLTWSKKAIACASQILALGIPVGPVDLRGVDMIGDTAPFLTLPLHQFFGIGTLHGADSVLVRADYHLRRLDATFSALLASKSVRHLDIHIDKTCITSEARRERLWQWIAMVVFSGHAANGIHKLKVDASTLNERDVETVRRLLEAPDPLSLLFSTRARDRVVSASRFRLTRPLLKTGEADDAESPPSTIVFGSPVHDLVVFNVESLAPEWISVLLPGWGQAWVAASDAVVTVSRPANVPKVRANRQVILLASQDRKGVAVGALLGLVAPQVQMLGLQCCSFSGTTMRRILNICPRLEATLLEDVDLSYLHRIASAYEDGRCRAKRLYLLVDELLEEEDAFRFFDYLTNPRHAMTQCLRVLHMTYKSRERLPQIKASVLRMLQQNRWLHELRLQLEFRDDSDMDTFEDEEPSLQAQCNLSDGETIVSPLDLLQKLAFLSVVQSPESVLTAAKAVKVLDSNVLTTIFQFAAQSHTRFVHVSFYENQ